MSRGAFPLNGKAEITPVEPEQGNTCEGKVRLSKATHSPALFLVPIIVKFKNGKMKKFLGTLIILVIVLTARAQGNLTGAITDKSLQPLKNATVVLNAKNFKRTTLTNENGQFDFSNLWK